MGPQAYNDAYQQPRSRGAVRDFLQSASNAVAGGVSGPVDLLASGMRGVGLPVGNEPVGGSAWMERKGLTSPVPQGAASILGETAGMVAPTALFAKAPQIAGALLQGGRNLAAPRTLNPQTGAIVWHGTPHKFDAFDSSKIGTGEGAQAYGHGLYLAESPDVARNYREALSKTPVTSYVAGGAEIVPGSSKWHAADIADRMREYAIDPKTKDGRDWLSSEIGARYMSGADVSKAEVMKYLKGGVEQKKELGALYKVDLPDEKIARMLDWDKPLAQNPQPLRDVFAAAMKKDGYESYVADGQRVYLGLGEEAALKGRDAYRRLHEHAIRSGKPQPAAVKEAEMVRWLSNAGVPGVRYLDGGSRGAGSGSSNFVVFPGEESALKILERNGQKLR